MKQLLDVTSLLMRRNMPVMTGIDRVEYALAHWALENDIPNDIAPAFLINTRLTRGILTPLKMKHLLSRSRNVRSLNSQPGTTLTQLFACLARAPEPIGRAGAIRLRRHVGGKPPLASWATTLDGLMGQRFAPNRRSGNTLKYVHVSHYGLQWPERFQWILRDGVDATFYVHDLIPIDFPEFCSAGAHLSHKRKLDTISRVATRVAVNSEDTAGRLEAYFRTVSLRIPPIEVVRLGDEPLTNHGTVTPRNAPHLPRPRPYYLCGGTLEGRKNIPALLEAWRILARDRSPKDMPLLVLAGERGWSAQGLFRDLDEMQDISPFIVEVSGLNDAEFQLLENGAEAIISASFTEGYSLVPAQAMSRGKMALMSDIPVHRELALGREELVAFFDPRQPQQLCDIIGRPRKASSALARPRRWKDFAEELLIGGNATPGDGTSHPAPGVDA